MLRLGEALKWLSNNPVSQFVFTIHLWLVSFHYILGFNFVSSFICFIWFIVHGGFLFWKIGLCIFGLDSLVLVCSGCCGLLLICHIGRVFECRCAGGSVLVDSIGINQCTFVAPLYSNPTPAGSSGGFPKALESTGFTIWMIFFVTSSVLVLVDKDVML